MTGTRHGVLTLEEWVPLTAQPSYLTTSQMTIQAEPCKCVIVVWNVWTFTYLHLKREALNNQASHSSTFLRAYPASNFHQNMLLLASFDCFNPHNLPKQIIFLYISNIILFNNITNDNSSRALKMCKLCMK